MSGGGSLDRGLRAAGLRSGNDQGVAAPARRRALVLRTEPLAARPLRASIPDALARYPNLRPQHLPDRKRTIADRARTHVNRRSRLLTLVCRSHITVACLLK